MMFDVMFTGRSGASMSLIQVFATIKPRNFVHKILQEMQSRKKSEVPSMIYIFLSCTTHSCSKRDVT